ncbi:MAG: hypothetical protein GY868_13880, partial [Deltaproteobacteria bacterium]|nr:hypothetical protein [Deltaproteobacteria bacterium]
MNRFIRWAVMLATASVLFICGNTLAGDLEPPASPSDTGSAMYTFNDLYNRLATGAEGAKRTGGFAGLAILPEPSGRTITEIMSIMPATDANAASPADVIAGKIFWSLKAGSWGVRTGSLSAAHYDPTADDSGSVGEDIPLAGNLDPPSGPPDAGSAMYTLNDLYNRLATGAAGTDPEGGFTDPAASPAGTGRTIDEIMALMPAVLGDPSTSASPAYVIQGKKFWGLKDGAWGVQTGTLPLTCYGLAADDPNVCSGHGTCSTFDVCGCDTSYYGDECGDWSCFTYHWADSDTCGGHGDCVAPDHCVCDENYFNDYSY